MIGAGIYSIEGRGYKVFDSHARDMYGNSHSEGTCVLLEIQSAHKLVLPTLKLIFFQAVLNIVVYQMLIVCNVLLCCKSLWILDFRNFICPC